MATRPMEERIANINNALTQLRPYLEEDGGDITFIEITDDNIVRVMLHGACSSCSMSAMTLKAGVEEAIKRVDSEVVGIEAVNMPDPALATPLGQ